MYIPIPVIIFILILLFIFSRYWRARILAVIMIPLTILTLCLILFWFYDIYLVLTDFNKFYLAGIFIAPIAVFVLVEIIDNIYCYYEDTLQKEELERSVSKE